MLYSFALLACFAAPEDVKWALKREAHVVLAGRRLQIVPRRAARKPLYLRFSM